MDTSLIPWIYAAIMTVGVTYLLFSVFVGGVADLDADIDVDVDLDGGGLDAASSVEGQAGEARGLGCSVISAFLAGFGSVGLMASLSGWDFLFGLLVAVAFGLIFGRTSMAAMRFVLRQQSNDLLTTRTLIGSVARITVNVPPGKTGEALVEGESLIKYPVKAVSDEVALNKGDYVEIVDVQGGRLFVKKKRILEDA